MFKAMTLHPKSSINFLSNFSWMAPLGTTFNYFSSSWKIVGWIIPQSAFLFSSLDKTPSLSFSLFLMSAQIVSWSCSRSNLRPAVVCSLTFTFFLMASWAHRTQNANSLSKKSSKYCQAKELVFCGLTLFFFSEAKNQKLWRSGVIKRTINKPKFYLLSVCN